MGGASKRINKKQIFSRKTSKSIRFFFYIIKKYFFPVLFSMKSKGCIFCEDIICTIRHKKFSLDIDFSTFFSSKIKKSKIYILNLIRYNFEQNKRNFFTTVRPSTVHPFLKKKKAEDKKKRDPIGRF